MLLLFFVVKIRTVVNKANSAVQLGSESIRFLVERARLQKMGTSQ